MKALVESIIKVISKQPLQEETQSFQIEYKSKSGEDETEGKATYQAPDEATARKRFTEDHPNEDGKVYTITSAKVAVTEEAEEPEESVVEEAQFDKLALSQALNKASNFIDPHEEDFVKLIALAIKNGKPVPKSLAKLSSATWNQLRKIMPYNQYQLLTTLK